MDGCVMGQENKRVSPHGEGNQMSVNEDKHLGEAVADRETEQDAKPWLIHENRVPGYERTITIVDEGDLAICFLAGAGSSNPKVLERVRANARLIAATPALYDAVSTLLLAMEMQEGRERKDLHILPREAWHVWTNAKLHARAALALVDKPADESAKQPISDRTTDGQASESESV
jgi:hypothetical protein